jgi:CIC family chloride channel protein
MTLRRATRRYQVKAIRFFHRSVTTGPLLLAATVGVGGGLGAVFFRWLIATVHRLMWAACDDWLAPLGSFRYVIAPAVGGLVVGPLIYFFAREAKGHGVPEVMLAVAREGGRIRPRVAIIKSLASAVCIGSGGSVGREGPIAQIGSTVGSTLGQILRMPEQRTKLLVGCGAAAGIAATFNAPVAGTLFALEIILRDFGARSFGMVVISSATATVVARAAFGDASAFHVAPYALRNPVEMLLYVLLGGICALVSTVFVKVLYACEDAFDAWRSPEYVKPVAGGLMIGLIAVVFPQVFGVGYGAIEDTLAGRTDIALCAVLIVMKLAATSLTIGSGGSGGVFAPSLFIGAMVGTTFGAVCHHLLPSVTAPAGAYALVGMGALFAGAARAPVTAILILFEMTGDYRIIIPLMCCIVTSNLIAERLSVGDIYTTKLRRRGIKLRRGMQDPLEMVRVANAMTRDFDVVPVSMPVRELSKKFSTTGHHGFPVVDGDGLLMGVVALSDMESAATRGEEGVTAGDIATSPPIVCYPDQTLGEALREVGALDVGRLPVVDRDNPRQLIGLLRRHDIIGAYSRAATGLPLEAPPSPLPQGSDDDQPD